MNNSDKRKLHREKTWKAFFYNIGGVILPFILSLLPILLFNRYEAIWEFLDEGEFLLFSAGLYTTSFYIYGENGNSVTMKTDKILKNVSVLLLIVCAAFYAVIYCVKLFHNFPLDLNTPFLRIASILLFIGAVWSVYRSLYIEYLKIIPRINVPEQSKSNVEDIMSQLPNEK